MKFNTTVAQTISIVVVFCLLILTAIGNAELLFWFSLTAMFLLFVWCLFDRKVWLATVSGVAFAATVLLTAKSLF